MSSRQRKRPGGAVDSRPARKRSRLLPSSAAGTSQTEPIDLEQSGTPAFGPAGEEVIDLTGESSESEVITISDDESAVEREQSQQQPHIFRALENSAEPLARDDEEEPSDTDDDWLRLDFDLPYWSDEDSEDREQNQQHPHVSSAAENSAGLLARDYEEEPDFDGPWPAGPDSPPSTEDEDSEDWELPHFFRTAENSAELPARVAEEEPRDNQGWPESVYVARFWMHYYSEWWYLRRQPHFVRAEDNSAVLVMRNNEEERRNNDDAQPAGPASPPTSEDEDSELLQVHEQGRRNVTVNSQEQVDGSGNGTGANEAPVADPAPAEQGSEEEDTESSDAQPGVVIRCPICMDFYSEITQRGRQLVSTMCGHVFCSRCLPIALENAAMCPTCRVDLSPELYHPIYL